MDISAFRHTTCTECTQKMNDDCNFNMPFHFVSPIATPIFGFSCEVEFLCCFLFRLLLIVFYYIIHPIVLYRIAITYRWGIMPIGENMVRLAKVNIWLNETQQKLELSNHWKEIGQYHQVNHAPQFGNELAKYD